MAAVAVCHLCHLCCAAAMVEHSDALRNPPAGCPAGNPGAKAADLDNWKWLRCRSRVAIELLFVGGMDLRWFIWFWYCMIIHFKGFS